MKNNIFIFLLLITSAAFSQSAENEKLIELGKAYKNFMFRNDPTKEIVAGIRKDMPLQMQKASEFIIQTLTPKNKLLTPEYLQLPEEKTIKNIYIIDAINSNLRNENQVDNIRLIDSLQNQTIPRQELVDNYYGMLFTAVGNKNQPFNFSNVNFKPSEYNLVNDTEKGIFFLKCMELCSTSIWGYMNIVNPPNTDEAYKYIKKFPKFNGLPYYQYNDLSFPDFKMVIITDEGKTSYKSYYINKYYDALITHLICLNKKNAGEKEKNDLLLGSILKDQSLYKYSEHEEILEKIFQAVNK